MVRVIPVHNFSGQSVASIEEPTASCPAKYMDREMLLLALSSHCVEVHELTPEPRLASVFPTVDLVRQMLHCDRENYIATLESKCSRDGASVNNFVRIYVNWSLGGSQNQAMRARIAGRVTPSSNRLSNSLEMIELPLTGRATKIACCQTTGNLLVGCGDAAILHELKVERQAHSKRKFIDFEACPWSLGFNFAPSALEIAEDFFLISDERNFMVFRLTNRLYDELDLLSSPNSTESVVERSEGISRPERASDEIRESSESRNTTFDPTVRVYSDPSNCLDWDRFGEERQNCVDLPSLRADSHKPGPISNPFVTSAPDLEVAIKTSSPVDGWSENYAVQRLLQLKIREESSSRSELFACSLLKPVYLKRESCVAGKKCILRSERYKNLNGVACVLCTTQEGHLFYFPSSSGGDSPLCTSYPFTAPVSHVVLEDAVLHALTEAGLESYTLRMSYAENCETKNTTSEGEPVSLIGLRPFMGVRRLLHVDRYLVLLSQADDQWTLYSLSLPDAEELFGDVLGAATNHRTSSPATYRHLLREGHIIASLAKDVEPSRSSSRRLEDLYRKSCALLAEYYVNSELPAEWNLCVGYYALAGTRVAEVLSQKSINAAPGIGTYVTETLLRLKSGPEADALFQCFNIVEIVNTTSKKNLLKLIFGSAVLREYATEKLTSILLGFEQDDLTKFALVLLYVQADRQEQAEKTIKPITDNCVMTMSLKYWNCLFDVTQERHNSHEVASFSDLAIVLMRQKSAIFADVLVKIVDARAVTLHQILQIFLAHLPSRVGRDGHVAAAVLQIFVEAYLRKYFKITRNCSRDTKRAETRHDYSIIEAFKILVRSYLGKLTQTNVYALEDEGRDAEAHEQREYLFEHLRPSYLDKIIATGCQDEKNSISKSNENSARKEILKLQALLTSGYLPDECYQEVQQFLKAHSIDGDFSFRLLCVGNNEGTHMLIDHCPQALFQYAKERYHEESEWKYLVQLLYETISGEENNSDVCSVLEQALEDTLIHLARTMSLKGLQRLLSNESTSILQRYGDICSQIMHADHVNSMIIGTGQHLLFNINV